MVKNKLYSVTIGIAAFNEENNICNLLTSVLQQKEIGFKIIEIILISDGSFDKTVQNAKKIKNKKITIIEGKTRIGQNIRLNQILDQSKSEILVLLEADTILGNEYFIEQLIKPFRYKKNIELVQGFALPLPKKNVGLIEKSILFFDSLKKQSFRNLKNGNNIYLFGSSKALTQSLIHKLRWPKDVPEDSYAYFFCKKNNIKTWNQPNAIVYYRSPVNLLDYFRKTTRFNKGKLQHYNYFSKELIDQEYSIPKTWIFSLLFKGFSSSIFLMIIYLLIHFLSKIYVSLSPKFYHLWDMSVSTKKLYDGKLEL